MWSSWRNNKNFSFQTDQQRRYSKYYKKEKTPKKYKQKSFISYVLLL
jgi:hypothetical protein